VSVCLPNGNRPALTYAASLLAPSLLSRLTPGRDRSTLNDPRFRVVKAVALDLFPHTAHVESVVMLERD
jgi:hypothetical protein